MFPSHLPGRRHCAMHDILNQTHRHIDRPCSHLPQQVDVDLAAEGDARKVSRRAASITLHRDGAFRLRCIGRRSVRARLLCNVLCCRSCVHRACSGQTTSHSRQRPGMHKRSAEPAAQPAESLLPA